MTDREDVGARIDDSLRRAAARAYQAANGVIEEQVAGNVDDVGPVRWRWLLEPRVAITSLAAIALVGALVVWLPRPAGGAVNPVEAVDVSGAPVASSVVGPGGAGPGGDVAVHVAGHVAHPGLYDLAPGARVADAIEAAGGPLDDAALDAVNLARVVTDGEQVLVPSLDDATAAGTAGGLINVNQADAALLEDLPGVGPVLAGRIVSYRDAHGPFASVDALDAVSGVGPAVLEGLRAEATV